MSKRKLDIPPHPNSPMVQQVIKAEAAFQKATAEGRACSYSYDATKGGLTHFWVGKQPKRLQGRCGAYCRSSGEPCKLRPVKGKRRCRLHGGLSTGARTPEGRARQVESNRRRAANRAAQLERGREVLAEIERRQREGLPLVP